MADRRAELERKRQKLALIRAQKESNRRREQPANPINLHDETGKENNINNLRLETDQLLTSLGFSSVDSVLSKNEDSNILHSNNTESSNELYSTQTKKLPSLSVAILPDVIIPPKEHVTYTKQTQTTGTERDDSDPSNKRKAHTHDYYVLNWDDESDSPKFHNTYFEWDDEFEQVLTFDDMNVEEDGSSIPFGSPPTSHPSNRNKPHKENGLPNVEYVKPAITPLEAEQLASEELQKTKIKKKPVELTEDEKKQILLSDEFQRFFNRASRIMERALIQNESADIFIDYTGAKEEMDNEDKHGNTLSLNQHFQDDKWTKNRVISSFDWCTQYPELLVAAYTATEQHQPNIPDGVCLIWNLRFKQTTPEYILTCQSPVMSCCFTKFHPNLIVGGTYSGQIVLWDNRSNKRTPVQRSPLSTAAHTHPIYCVQVVGTQNSHNLITVSTDGKLCSWSLDMLSAAQDTLELNQSMQSKPVAVTSMSFPNGDYNNFVLGSEEGSAYTACRHGAKAGILESYTGHQAPITSVDYNQVQGQIDFSHLFLSSSMDWTVKLWSTKEKTGKPLHSFEDNFDYVYDAKWSPINPALFATVDGQGRTDLWNLNNDTELPTASITTENNTALSKLVWTPSGNQIVTGDDQGKIYLYDVGEQLSQPKNDENTRFMNTLQELKTSSEQDVDN